MTPAASNPVNADGEPIPVPLLVQKARSGDEAAFGELMQAYYPRVYGMLLGMVRNPDDARDLSQQVWVKVWKKLDTFKGDADFYTWLYRVAHFSALDAIRKQKRRREVDLLDALEPNRDADVAVPPSLTSRPDDQARATEIYVAFQTALEQLSPEHRTALMLREVEGLSYDEIARITKSRRGTIMSRIFYARKSMQQLLKEYR